MRLRFWGVRGSHVVAGPTTVRYGGNTSCVEVIDGTERLIVDAGSGLRALGQTLPKDAHYNILLSHAHWDHVQGLPFFAPLHEKSKLTLWAGERALAALHDLLRAPHVVTAPLPVDCLTSRVTAPGRDVIIGSFAVMPVLLNHPAGALGYRMMGNAACAYLSDTAPFHQVLHGDAFLTGVPELTDAARRELATMRRQVVDVLRGVHTVIYDTQYSTSEFHVRAHYGHSTPEHALELCAEAGVRRLVLFHHAPDRDDAAMDVFASEYRLRGQRVGVDVVAAYEGLELVVGAS